MPILKDKDTAVCELHRYIIHSIGSNAKAYMHDDEEIKSSLRIRSVRILYLKFDVILRKELE